MFLPTLFRTDLSITQDIFTNIRGSKNAIQVRADILNFGNLLSKDWGGSQRLVTNQPLVLQTTPASGVPLYRLRNVGTNLVNKTFERTVSEFDVWRMQLGLRYTFN